MRLPILTTLAAALAGTIVSGQGVATTDPPISAVRPSGLATTTKGMPAGVKSMIRGTVVDADSRPLPNVIVRLRNLASKAIEQTTTANQVGEFAFAVKPDAPYVIEVVNQSGNVVAVGSVVSAQTNGIAGTTVALPVRLTSLASVLGDTAGAVVSAAAGTGITVLQSALPAPPPLSPER